MRRSLFLPMIVLAVWALGAQQLFAQGDGGELDSGWSGPGIYLSPIKLAAVWLLFLLWVRSTDWASRDGQEMKLEYVRWNMILFGSFTGGFLLVFLIPIFWIGFPLLVLAYVVPFTFFVVYRNKRVDMHETVFTEEHLRHWFADRLAPLGVKIEKDPRDPHSTGPPVILSATGGEAKRDDTAHMLAARQAPGLRDVRHLLADGFYHRCDAMMLDFTQEIMGVRHMVDGVWHTGEPWERDVADPLLEAMKIVCGLNPEDRRSRQEGAFGAEYMEEPHTIHFSSQGTETGERVVLRFEGHETLFDALDDVGMRPKMQEQLKEFMAATKGLILFSGMPGAGLRSTMTVALSSMDRFMRESITVDEERTRYEEVENIAKMTYAAAQGQTPDTVLPDLFHKEPEVIVIRDLVNAQTVSVICQEIARNRLFISSVRAKDSCEALLRVLAMGAPPAELARAVTGVLCQRLVRKLCDECKEAYAPTPQVLQQLRIPAGKVEAFYRPPQESDEMEICMECAGLGYHGRTAIFELLHVDDNVRKVLASNPKIDLLRQAARKAGLRSFQEEGMVLVVKGVTSLPELTRVLKQ